MKDAASLENMSKAGHITLCGFPRGQTDPAQPTSISVTLGCSRREGGREGERGLSC